MVGAIVRLLAGIGVPKNYRRGLAEILLVGALALLLWIGLGMWLSGHDKAVIAADRAAGDVAAMNSALAADRAAGAAKDQRDRAFAAEQSALQEKADAAADNGASPLDALFNELH